MISNLKSIYSYFIFAGIFIIILAIIFFFATKKYNKKRVKFFALFVNLNRKGIILISSFILNFTLVSYFAVKSLYFNNLIIYIIAINVIISCIVSLKPRLIISNIIYSLISVFSLKIINLVYNYLFNIYYDKLTFILSIIFVLMLIVYELFITFRLTEIVLKYNKMEVQKNGRKSKQRSTDEQ